MLFRKQPKPAEQIAKDRETRMDEMLKRAIKMRRLVDNERSGWIEFIKLLDGYIEVSKKRKLATALDKADNDTIQELKYLDHDIYMLQWIKKIPQQFIGNVEKELEAQKKKEENQNENV